MTAALARGGRGRVVAVATAAVVVVGALGGIATDIGPWYRALAKPSWQPPDWLFGPAWSTIYALIVASVAIAWPRADGWQRRQLLQRYGANAVLNVLWSVLFFAMKRPDWALVEVALLWASIVAMIAAVRPVSTLAAWLLAPYLAWVTFASVLNATIVQLNGPFPLRAMPGLAG